ncbi:adenylate kinase 8 [Myripristis murdjan]|uniref:adenylate kinase 8 n=1 Tax=Myripristis murdjan TaxID=586833 RepID=UPI0011760DD7|nr:adenylate kinase 8-like [Myripristis murdjan]
MDETVKPVRIPPEMCVYADTHHVFNLVQSLLSSLLVDRPDEPLGFLIDLLKSRNEDAPRLVLLGPPAAGKRTVARKLCAELGCVHVTVDTLLDDQSDLSKQAMQYTHAQQELPAELLVQLIQRRLAETDCLRQGWLLEGLPQTRQQALCLQEAGISPRHAVLLEAPGAVLLERRRGQQVDPLTGDVYHQTFVQPADLSVTRRLERGRSLSEEWWLAELQRFRCEVTGLSSAYQHVLKRVNADQPHSHVYQQVLGFVQTRQPSSEPCIPRILLFGPPGSGKSLQARLLSEKYKMVNVSCGQLLQSVAADDSAVGEQVRHFLETGQQVPDGLVLQVLTQRLSRLDCSSRGWILHGFPPHPPHLEQLQGLQASSHLPNSCSWLATERLAASSFQTSVSFRWSWDSALLGCARLCSAQENTALSSGVRCSLPSPGSSELSSPG